MVFVEQKVAGETPTGMMDSADRRSKKECLLGNADKEYLRHRETMDAYHLLSDIRRNVIVRSLWLWSAVLFFSMGLLVGIMLPFNCSAAKDVVYYEEVPASKVYPQVTFVDEPKDSENVIVDSIYWGALVEKSLPSGYDPHTNDKWVEYLGKTSAVKLESGCGRMQNRMVTFSDGERACVRYRQNTDQIQGELFSFYLAQALDLPNLAPSAVSLVNLTDRLWRGVVSDMGSAQWNSNRPVVLTKYIPNLESARIPDEFKPSDRHLNKADVAKILRDETEPDSSKLSKASVDRFVELAQWSDLIIFDYLTGNLDRMVNNMYNYQWNANIMEAPAHNLAKKTDSDLLVFLDNESGLLHGYRLLYKYEVYHSGLLDGLCMFRKKTVENIEALHKSGAAGATLNKKWEAAVSGHPNLAEALPPLPSHTQTLLQERLTALVNHINHCRSNFSN